MVRRAGNLTSLITADLVQPPVSKVGGDSRLFPQTRLMDLTMYGIYMWVGGLRGERRESLCDEAVEFVIRSAEMEREVTACV